MTDTTPEAVERLARVLDEPFYRVEGYGGPYIDEATLRDEHTAAAATLRALLAEVERLTSHHYTGSRVEDAITAHWGSRCYDFAEGCSCCEAWAEYDRLTAAAQTPPEDVGALIAAAHGLSFGDDWNGGTAARTHGYREKLLIAIDRIKGGGASPQATAALAKQGGA